MPRQKKGTRRVTHVGRINYNRPRIFRLPDVARVSNKLFSLYTTDDDYNAPDSTVHYMFRLFGDWMQFRGLYEKIYGADDGLNGYREFLEWFDKFVGVITDNIDKLSEVVPGLTVEVKFVKAAASLYLMVRDLFPV